MQFDNIHIESNIFLQLLLTLSYNKYCLLKPDDWENEGYIGNYEQGKSTI